MVRRWAALWIVGALVLAGCGSDESGADAGSSSEAPTTTVPFTELDACRVAFRQYEESPDGATPPAPYAVCSHADFFRVTLEEAQRGAPGYDVEKLGGEQLSRNCALLRLVAPEPKACVGVAPPPAPTTTARPATVRPPATQPPSGIPEVRPPLGPTERAPFGATAQCRDGTFVYTRPPAQACAQLGGVELLL